MEDIQTEPWMEEGILLRSDTPAGAASTAESAEGSLVEIAPATSLSGEPLYCPFPSEVHPDAEAAQRQTTRWAESFGLVHRSDRRSRVRLEKYTGLVGRMFPSGSRERFQVISDFTSWLFLHDDVCDESSASDDPVQMTERFRRQLDLMLHRAEPDLRVPLEVALCDLRDRLEALAPDPAWMLRFVCSFQDYFEACAWEAENRRAEVTPDPGLFIPLRRCAGAVWLYLHFIDLLKEQTLALAVREHSDIQRLRQITCNVVAWHNDLFSLQKEMMAGDVHNLVTVLQHDNQLDLERALALATRYTNAEVRDFVTIAARPPDLGPILNKELEAYVGALERFIRGALDWARETVRYSPPAAAMALPA